MEVTHNVVGWFEIPVMDMERAIQFYEEVCGYKLERHQMESLDMAWFPVVVDAVGSPGSLVFQPDFYKPSREGPVLYITAFSGDCANELSRVEKAGGKLILEKTKISDEYGYYGLFLDTEGNRVAFHSRA